MKQLNKILVGVGTFLVPLATFAQDITGQTTAGSNMLKEAGEKGAGYKPNVEIYDVVGTVISAVLTLLGVIFLVLTVYGGYQWLIARGDEGKVELAKNTITRSIIGLTIVLGAYGITYFVIDAITKTTITK